MAQVLITGTGSELQGVGRLSDGRAVFVPEALPGETVELEIVREAPRFCEARLVRVVEPSPDRAVPTCPHYGRCGGCRARHMNYDCTLRLKRQRVFDALSRLGGVDDPQVRETIGCAEAERLRNKAEYAVEMRGGALRIGCLEARSHRVIDLEDCLLQKAESVRALNWLRAHLAEYAFAPQIRGVVTRVNRAGEMTLTLCGDAPIQNALRALAEEMTAALPELRALYFCRLKPRPTHALDGACTCVAGAETIEDELMGLRFELSPQSFFQVNPIQAEALYRSALDAVEAGPKLRLLDAYCGAGTITLAAAQRGARVVGVEIVAPAIENARRNAQRNHLQDRARFICGDAAREIPRLLSAGERFDAAILDPPRRGADEALLAAISNARIPRIAYVSCNPSTLARDVKRLSARGYRLLWAQPVDMFPWTEHVECAVLMARADG